MVRGARAWLVFSTVALLGARTAEASFINYLAKEINVKVVYFGASAAGPTENLQYIYEKTSPEAKGKLIPLSSETEPFLFFDFVPLGLGEIRGFKIRFHLYTAPGRSPASLQLLLKGADGIVFVADSDPARAAANVAALDRLKQALRALGYDWKSMPRVVQLERRDLPNAMPVDEMRRQLGLVDEATFEAVPPRGVGVFDTLKAIAKQILLVMKKGG